jgi:hypothetical protein
VNFDEIKIRLFWLKEPEKTLPRKSLPRWILDHSLQSFREELGAKPFVEQTRMVFGGSGRHRPQGRAVDKTIRSFF